MIANFAIFPQLGNGKTGDAIREVSVTFSADDASAAAEEVGCAVFEAVLLYQREDPSVTAFDMSIDIKVDVEPDDLPRPFIIEEKVTYRLTARSAEEAEELWLNKGDVNAEFLGVNDRDIYADQI